ncbi:MAG: threonine--tRNA ligase, partial [bacterium]|nr:threonine--tRNA ligase [bacterium]
MSLEKNEKLELTRHSLSHVMAAAVLKLYPKAKFAIGPAVDNGFYYDLDFAKEKLSDSDLAKIEEEMKAIIKANLPFEKSELPVAKALAREKKSGQIYKLELIQDLKKQGDASTGSAQVKTVSYYKLGEFEDLCRGPHLKSSGQIQLGSFKLEKLAGAYWRGDEKNKMLTRIYGLAFSTRQELENYLKMIVEAEKRDHRKLGKELEIFTFSDEIGAGLPIWLPKGAILREELEKLAKEKETELGYQRVSTPLITKEDLFYKSGHLPHYKESMYSPMEIDGEKYYLKPMNCPFHHTIYASKPRSYRELPLKLAEYGMCHRYEKSGELQGLFRVRAMMMNDAHIYVRPDQVKAEIKEVIELHEYYYKLFGVKTIKYRLSKHDPKDLGGKYVNLPKAWEANEQILREVLQELKADFYEAENEAAFYGPKIDINIYSVIGKEYTLGTIQLDFAQPQKFNLTYIDKDGKDKMPYCIHRAPLSVHERFIGFLIEHYAGAFPVWLSPVQVKIVSVGATHVEFCKKLAKEFIENNIRVEVDETDETVGNKIRKAVAEKVPYMLVVGDREMNSDKLAVRDRGEKTTREIAKREFMEEVKEKIKNR